MGSHLILAVAAMGLGFAAPQPQTSREVIVVRGDCSAAAREALSENGGTLLSVEPVGNECVITILVRTAEEEGRAQADVKPAGRAPRDEVDACAYWSWKTTRT